MGKTEVREPKQNALLKRKIKLSMLLLNFSVKKDFIIQTLQK